MEKETTKKQFSESDAMQEIFKRVGSFYNEFSATGKNATIKNFANFLKDRIPEMQQQIEQQQKEIETLKTAASEYEQKIKESEEKFAEKEKQLQEAEAKVNNANTNNTESEKILAEKDEQIQAIKQQLAEMEQQLQETEARANENARIATVENSKKSVSLLPEVETLLQVVAKKLTDRYKKTINADDILNVMFLRYNVEKWSNWFYPFVLTDEEIEQHTGKTVQQWKEFFNTKK